MSLSAGSAATEHVWLPAKSSDQSWWDRYESVLAESVGSKSRSVIGADAEFIVQRCILAEPDEPDEDETASRERRGVVMGAVQSGKTASMLAVIAKSLDAGVDAVVVLGGTRTALWLQTWERLLGQLDTLEEKYRRRVMLPTIDPSGVTNGAVGSTLYVLNANQVTRALDRDRPIIIVAMKQVAHLERVARTLREVVYPAVQRAGRPYHLLVVDDEADDSSIDESDLTVGASYQERQVPRRIVDLWESRQLPGETAIPEAPSHLPRLHGDAPGELLAGPEQPARAEGLRGLPAYPRGRRRRGQAGAGFQSSRRDPRLVHGRRHLLQDPLVGAAVRSCRRTVRGRTARARRSGIPGCKRHSVGASKWNPVALSCGSAGLRDGSRGEGSQRPRDVDVGAPVCGDGRPLQHRPPSARMVRGTWPGRRRGPSHQTVTGALVPQGSSPTWTTTPSTGPSGWTTTPGRTRPSKLDEDGPSFPDVTWEQLRQLILDEIVPVTSVAVINSDVRAADRPVFEPLRQTDGWRAAPNLSTIFVSGNVMSRGLTLDGLTTTLFTRHADDPASDTQMQMQRWFGYRGSFIDVCRVLMPEQQIALFTEYHETDLALRIQVLDAMGADSPAPPTVLQGRAFKASGKVRNVRGRGLWPGHEPFTTWLNSPELDIHNQEVVANLFQGPAAAVPGEAGDRGLLLDRSLTMVEVADLLNMLRYPAGSDGSVDPDAARHWAAVQAVAESAQTIRSSRSTTCRQTQSRRCGEPTTRSTLRPT